MVEAAVAEVIEYKLAPITRFYIADLTAKGQWILERLLKAYPNQNSRSIIGWLNGILDNNEFLCLAMPHAVCIAERVPIDRLAGKLQVREVLVWCQNPADEVQKAQAADFYPRMAQWARTQTLERLVVCERSDVPRELVEAKLGKLTERKVIFARV